MKIRIKLSEKILLITAGLATVFVITALLFFRDSPLEIMAMGAIIYIVSIFITYVISNKYSRRLHRLTFRVEKMAAGDLTEKLEVSGRDEIDQLTHALNELVTRLKTGVAQHVSAHKELAQAKSDFVTIASHQLRTPLSIIKWYIDYMASGDAGKLSPEQERYLKEVYKSNERLIELVNALLDVSRIDVGTFSIEPEPTDIIERAESALQRFMGEIKAKQIILEKEYDKFPLLKLDPRLTKIVFQNIISNAVKYTPEGGRIRLVVKKTERDIYIKCSDSGIGIQREDQPKMFTKLFRSDPAKKIESVGTGLGLYIVKAVIEKSGGKIWIQSPSLELLIDKEVKDKKPIDQKFPGTTIHITIPLKGMREKPGTKKLTSMP